DDGVHTRAVWQAGVDVRRGLVDPAADAADDHVDDPQQMRLVDELRVRLRDLAVALDVDRLVVVDHDFRDGLVTEEGLERPVAQDVVRDLADDVLALLPGERRLLDRQHLGDDLVHLLLEVRVGLPVLVEETGAEARDDLLVDARLQLGEWVGDDGGALGLLGVDRLGLVRLARDLDPGMQRHRLPTFRAAWASSSRRSTGYASGRACPRSLPAP